MARMKKVCERVNSAMGLVVLSVSTGWSALKVNVESLPLTGDQGTPTVSAGLNVPSLSVTMYS